MKLARDLGELVRIFTRSEGELGVKTGLGRAEGNGDFGLGRVGCAGDDWSSGHKNSFLQTKEERTVTGLLLDSDDSRRVGWSLK